MALIYPEAQVECGEKAAYEQLKVLMATTFKAVSDEFSECMAWMDAEHVLKFDLPEVKWYPIYTGVQMFDKMMTAFDPDSDDSAIPGYCTEFVRVGEEDDDTESRRTGEDTQYYLNVRRSIDCNV